jgi:hypothetical protein
MASFDIAVSDFHSGKLGALQQLQWTKRLVEFSDFIGPKFRKILQDEAPVDSGRLRSSIRYSRVTLVGSVRIRWTAHVPYAPFVIEGTKAHRITAVAARTLHWTTSGGGERFAHSVWHPGTKPNDFPKRAADKADLGLDFRLIMLRGLI